MIAVSLDGIPVLDAECTAALARGEVPPLYRQAVTQRGLAAPLQGLQDPRLADPKRLLADWIANKESSTVTSYTYKDAQGHTLQCLVLRTSGLHSIITHYSEEGFLRLDRSPQGAMYRRFDTVGGTRCAFRWPGTSPQRMDAQANSERWRPYGLARLAQGDTEGFTRAIACVVSGQPIA